MIKINLAPPEARGRRKAAGRGFQLRLPEFNMGVAFAVLYVVALGGGGWYWHQLGTREAKLTDDVKKSTAELNVLKAKVAQDKSKDQLADLQKRVDAIQELTKTQSRLLVMLDSLADTVPRDLWLTFLEEKGTTITVRGAAFTTTAVADFMSNLRSSGRFKDVEILKSEQVLTRSPRLVTFDVTCRFENN